VGEILERTLRLRFREPPHRTPCAGVSRFGASYFTESGKPGGHAGQR